MFFQGNEKYNCATYLRLSRSDGDQQESNSIKNQRALLNAELASSEQIGIKILDSQITALEAELELVSGKTQTASYKGIPLIDFHGLSIAR